MNGFSISFSNPWLLFLIIPAVALTLIPYFRLSKKYRKTRNRIVSMILHTTIMVLCITVLSGIRFNFYTPNEKNEVILLVDVSESETVSRDAINGFVDKALLCGKDSNARMGVVTFGFDQKYAVPLTTDIDSIYQGYKNSVLPDTSATDIAAALSYTKDLFENPQSSKIVLVTDGKETDEEALSVIRTVSALGIDVDVAHVPSEHTGNEIQITSVKLPEYHVGLNDDCNIEVTLLSNYSASGSIKVTDNGADVENGTQSIAASNIGEQKVNFRMRFDKEGLHELKFALEVDDSDGESKNNAYYSYLNIENYNSILILGSVEGESERLETLLRKDEAYSVETDLLSPQNQKYKSVDDLRRYDEIILNNIANADMPVGFDALLYSYVNDYGGGLLTVGGDKADGTANAYNRKDMYGTLYQDMLPVEAKNYVPPRGVIIIVDMSGSMSSDNKLEMAKAGARSCLDALNETDYIGIMTLDDGDSTILPLTPATQVSKIRRAINSLSDPNGGTQLPDPINNAGLALRALTNVDKKHIIIVTDGEVPDNQYDDYMAHIREYYSSDGITLSMVVIGGSASDKMQDACDAGHGKLYRESTAGGVADTMREDLKPPEIYEQNRKPFRPIANEVNSPILEGVGRYDGDESGTMNDKRLSFTLGGFYGAKKRPEADVIIVGENAKEGNNEGWEVPIYAQWKFGKGSVGSFLCDLNGNWSSEMFVGNADLSDGERLIYNILESLSPTENIHPNSIRVNLDETNYINRLSVYTDLDDGEKVQGKVYDANGNLVMSLNDAPETPNDAGFVSVYLSAENNYTRSNFVIKKGGVYRIELIKLDAEGQEKAKLEFYKEFSYSAEYDMTLDEEQALSDLKLLALRGGGSIIQNLNKPVEIFENFVTVLEDSYNPAIPFIITAIVLFLLDIAVRKFKFKWIHEIIRERKDRKSVEK